MRQPKFRGFSPETNEWVYGYGWHETDYTDDFLRSINQSRQDAVLFTKTFPITCDIESMGEFTGLLDTNGVEIYEGDIIYYNIDNGVGIEHYQARVVWSENTAEYKNRFEWLIIYSDCDDFDDLSRPAAYNSELQVVGNIYENPELLEEGK
ncbi:hypothetical protein CHH80_10980 [Bacillus sp. 7504-2]|nr:hypothetical protein CHH80_10980 [Bacillus sp. 7504-2]